MGLFTHTCRPPKQWLFTRVWTCRCGQQYRVRPIRERHPEGTATAEAVPIGKASE